MDLARSSANASADEMTPRLVRDFPRHKAGALAQTERLKMTTPETLSNTAAEAISDTSSANKFHLDGSIGWMPISLHCYANIRRHHISDDIVREKIKELGGKSLYPVICQREGTTVS